MQYVVPLVSYYCLSFSSLYFIQWYPLPAPEAFEIAFYTLFFKDPDLFICLFSIIFYFVYFPNTLFFFLLYSMVTHLHIHIFIYIFSHITMNLYFRVIFCVLDKNIHNSLLDVFMWYISKHVLISFYFS